SSIRPDIERALGAGPIPGVPEEKLEQLARSFASAGASVALAGPVGATGPVAVETAIAVALLNHAAGRIGQTVDFSRPHAQTNAGGEAEVETFLSSLGPQDILFIHDANPLYSRVRAEPHLNRAGMKVYLGTMMDETAETAEWFLPVNSPLESWGDYEPAAGIHGLMQPTMEQLHDTRAAGDLFLALAEKAGKPLSRSGRGGPAPDFPAWLRERWDDLRKEFAPSASADDFWTTSLRNGGVWRKRERPGPVTVKPGAAGLLTAMPAAGRRQTNETAELWLWPSIMLYDGRLANRGWLQETPDPVTFIAWGNWIDIHPLQAADLKLQEGEVAELSTAAGKVRAPVRITDEVSPQMVALAFGQGHHALGKNARGCGANAFSLVGGAVEGGSMFGTGRIRRVEGKQAGDPTWTAPVRSQFDRHILQWVPLSKVGEPHEGREEELILPLPEGYRQGKDLYPKREYLAHRWAMVIDLQRCIGCGACAVACYAENNIAVMGKVQVGRQLEMAWLRVVPYRKPGSVMRYSWLPLLCQHCDAAPCEPVCPVFAAVHNEEGLNAQIYNRCIGTRYCANNCPYKVRRFNWLNTDWRKPLDLQLNPEVTVRSRGVMEKCTFCVQRIRLAEYRAKRENRKIRDGEIQPACAQSCPTRVYTFGDLLDPAAEVTRLTRSDPRRYHLLEELNTKPGVTFLRKVDVDA
ncbi:4Fe-4S dicluster domain-containing protein, partial [bacterium]